MTFNIAKQPIYGRLYNRGVSVATSFTQNDVDLGFITYESDGSRPGVYALVHSINYK